MKILTQWLRNLLPGLAVDDAQLAEDLTLRGIAVEGVFSLGEGNGSLFEMDITTNRVDAMSHYGVAREAAAIYGLALPPLVYALPDPHSAPQPFPVQIEAEDACGRFTARVLRGIAVADSRDWFPGGEVATYFNLLGQKKISSVVDATNFAWLAMGQPTHAFDLDKIEGGIVVRRARKGERLKTLDGVERILDAEDLIVADHAKPLGLAGVMGGWDTMITPQTTNVLVEAAWFDQVAVRRTARRHGLHTDASHRFERGADFAAASLASAIVSRILLANGGHIEGELVDVVVPRLAARTVGRKPVRIAFRQVHRLLGTTVDAEGIPAQTVEGVLGALGCGLERLEIQDSAGEPVSHLTGWLVQLPSWRLDLDREIDLIEEVARVYGYNRFANTLPAFSGEVRALPNAEKEAAVHAILRAAAFHESISSTFCSAADAALCAPQPGLAVPLGNPLSEEAGVMRSSLLPGMLAAIAGNLHRGMADVRLYEVGAVFAGSTEKVDERLALAIGAAGSLPQSGPHHVGRAIDFFDIKGILEQVLSSFQIRTLYFDRFPAESGLTPGWLHPYRAARVAAEGMTIGWFGQLHPRLAAERKLKEVAFAAELYLDRLFQLSLRKPAARELSRFQPVRRDFSLLVPQSVTWAQLEATLRALAVPEVVDFRARELFRDPKAGAAAEYSLLLGVTFQAADRTLRDEEIQEFSSRVVANVAGLGVRLRG